MTTHILLALFTLLSKKSQPYELMPQVALIQGKQIMFEERDLQYISNSRGRILHGHS
jgi:hypothetical protein